MINNYTEKDIKTFGYGLTGFLSILGAINLVKGNSNIYCYFFAAGLIAFIISIARPYTLKYLYKPMMILAHAIGWFNTQVLLSLIFFLLISPISLILRLTRKDLLNQRIDNSCESYWNKSSLKVRDKSEYHKQF